MKRIVALFLIAALALPAAAQNVAPPRLSSLSDLKADYLEALNSKRFPVHEISVWLVYRDGELTLTGFHPFYTPDSFYSGELVHIVKDFAKAELLSLDKERIRFVGVSNETGHGAWIDLRNDAMPISFPAEGDNRPTLQRTGGGKAKAIIALVAAGAIIGGLGYLAYRYRDRTSPYGTYDSHDGRTYYRGPQGGCYWIGSTGNRNYVDRSMCN